jgi:hypothetical protein
VFFLRFLGFFAEVADFLLAPRGALSAVVLFFFWASGLALDFVLTALFGLGLGAASSPQ